ncbi:immunity 22 family protein [Selenomonas ruminantium]|jgi:hypothetical protein|uniref:Immunity protein 22 n=1 Tax=Selenomonas ruminantium TaxID=971 RepID=A0A1I0VH63_SELRU|nr:immunity 22 family protein [Selenomonas ruminantium]SDZ72571.1 Immunity protein 22 [Selenomonas ruminantium]SFA74916.1 Immunity protein 22 [Selenomonas ruminantium]
MSDKCVSVFAGNLRDEDELYDYTEFRFNEDAPDDDEYDGYECVCCKDFGIDLAEVDEDFVEVIWKDGQHDLYKLLEGCSYLESFKNEIVNETDDDKMYNSAVLFYNYNYGGKKGTEKAGFTYLGTYAYEE